MRGSQDSEFISGVIIGALLIGVPGLQPRTDALGGAQGPSKDKVAVLSVDDCNVAVALQFGAEIGNYACAAAGVQTSSKK